jgi:hypothetical protein
MKQNILKVNLTASGLGEVTFNGQPITLRGFNIVARAGKATEVHLILPPTELDLTLPAEILTVAHINAQKLKREL